ncbi:MAG: hypothetical protein WCF84_00185 [Anaerolineae bacterium]
METTLTVFFDGRVLRPDSPLDLEPNTHYVIKIESAIPSLPVGDAWAVLEALAGTIQAPGDWASEHDHYLYGTPKQKPDNTK